MDKVQNMIDLIDLIKDELSDIDKEDLSQAEKNILRCIENFYSSNNVEIKQS